MSIPLTLLLLSSFQSCLFVSASSNLGGFTGGSSYCSIEHRLKNTNCCTRKWPLCQPQIWYVLAKYLSCLSFGTAPKMLALPQYCVSLIVNYMYPPRQRRQTEFYSHSFNCSVRFSHWISVISLNSINGLVLFVMVTSCVLCGVGIVLYVIWTPVV